ncbi:hypothetical protein A247_13364 [Pseudomonas syringae pv. actinidiae ICMP 19099]|nr:hypothetical protein A248_13209 [Pseudomonas syringae pv. actinidiae ICMP 19100]EPN26078.1 hypothetical protein A247_13364 [Pseudomonas syringae pv. actinidiae ICMP 19099]EPN34152.1 hypothetical protein A243_13879 [Pseudomonas syringae pv. actinidiae ICMP 18883]KTC49758.1 hypothetical protein AO250_14340 [Pseudomonas syringae pv. actinidiae ICMP 19497]MBL3875095.1 hypothetical protein [Pseudomonas syringae pv. theae]NAT17206.1 hypothetical protein [Pseudomonas syringae pv. actinidifoliorum]
MADYQCYPIWNMSSGEYGDMAPCELPISKDLQERLLKWAAVYDETLNVDYPPNSRFKSGKLERDFKLEGERLFMDLRSELGPEFSVSLKI